MNVAIHNPETAGMPKRRGGVMLYPLDEEAVVYDIAHDVVHYLNATARFIWERCDGNRTIHDIADELNEVFDLGGSGEASPDEIVADVQDTLDNLSGNGLIERPGF